MTNAIEQGRDVQQQDHAPGAHRWMRAAGDSGINHWCVDGDTTHHNEPCADAATGTGDHAGDTVPIDSVPIWTAP